MITLPTKTLGFAVAFAMVTGLRAEEAPTVSELPATPEKADALLNASFDSLAEVLNESREKVVEAENQRKLAVEELDARRKAHAATERELTDLKRQLADSRKSEAEWKTQSEKLAKKLAAGEEAHANLAKFRDQMKETLEEFSSLQGDIAQVRGELQAPAERMALREENARLQNQNAALGKQLNKAQTRFAAERDNHKKTRDQLAATTRRNTILENVLAESKETIKTLTARLDSSERNASSANAERMEAIQLSASLEKRAAMLQFEHSNMGKSLAAAEDSRKTAVAKLEKLQQSRDAAEDKAGKLDHQLKATNQELQKLQRANGELHEKVDQAVAALKSAREEHEKALTKRDQGARKELAEANEKLRQSKEALSKLKNDTVELRDISELTSRKLQSTEQKVEALENEKTELRKVLEQREKEVAQLQASLKESEGKETASNEVVEE